MQGIDGTLSCSLDFEEIGLAGFNFRMKPIQQSSTNNERINFMDLLIHLWPGDWREQLQLLNVRVDRHNAALRKNSRNKPSTRYTGKISEREFFQFFGIMLLARVFSRPGGKIWDSVEPEGIDVIVNASQWMYKYRFEQIYEQMAFVFADPIKGMQGEDPWWTVAKGIEGFNENRAQVMRASVVKVMDESMSAYRPRTSPTGTLEFISFVARKPEPLGTEFKVMADSKTHIMLHLELQKGKNRMKTAEYANEVRLATAACVARIVGATKRTHKKLPEDKGLAEVFLGDAWFASVKAAVACKQIHKSHFIGVVKTNSSFFPKKFLQETMKEWPAGSHLVLETKFEGVELLAIGYKYKKSKVINFIATKGAGHTGSGAAYEAKWKDSFGNTRSRPVHRPEIIVKYFKNCNGIDLHNQSRQGNLALEKTWVTREGKFPIGNSNFCNHSHRCLESIWFSFTLQPSSQETDSHGFHQDPVQGSPGKQVSFKRGGR
eukprot:Nitzschia sp. Nitz4//scaffold475_size5561//3915//5458//NITZ4_009216-RA/size5561-snap-gene-0.2-mRNA-1//-1//CDS//3329552714//4380//frame0